MQTNLKAKPCHPQGWPFYLHDSTFSALKVAGRLCFSSGYADYFFGPEVLLPKAEFAFPKNQSAIIWTIRTF